MKERVWPVAMRELVSIIIPAYQEEKRIERCLQSITASTYRDLELIVVNDGSTDNTHKVVEDFKEKTQCRDVLIEVVNIPNGGSGRARNFGLRRAKGQYIGFVDADDMIHPRMVERLAHSLHNGNDMASCGMLFCNGNGKARLRQCRLYRQALSCPNQALNAAMWEQIQMSLGPVFFRREKIIDKDGKLLVSCPEDVVAFEDFVFICRYLSFCDGIWERLPFYGYYYCKHAGSASSKRWSVEEISHALEPILTIGEGTNDAAFAAHKLQYAFRFLALWYEEAFHQKKRDLLADCAVRKKCVQELEKYADVYMDAANVSWQRKLAMWIAREHPMAGWWLAKIIGRLGMFGV